MAVQIELQHGYLAGNGPAEIDRPDAPTNQAPAVVIPLFRDPDPTSPSSLRQAAIRRRRRARRIKLAAEMSAWLGGSAFLTVIVLGGVAGLH